MIYPTKRLLRQRIIWSKDIIEELYDRNERLQDEIEQLEEDLAFVKLTQSERKVFWAAVKAEES